MEHVYRVIIIIAIGEAGQGNSPARTFRSLRISHVRKYGICVHRPTQERVYQFLCDRI